MVYRYFIISHPVPSECHFNMRSWAQGIVPLVRLMPPSHPSLMVFEQQPIQKTTRTSKTLGIDFQNQALRQAYEKNHPGDSIRDLLESPWLVKHVT